MAFVIADRVRETSTTIGTGNFTLAGAVTGYQTFDAALDTGDTTYYTIADQSGSNWEVGIGTFTSPSTLARTTILSSSNGGSVVTFGAGTKDVFISLPASKTNVEDQPNLIEVNNSSAALRITQTGAGNALVVEDSANPDSSPFVVDASGNVGIGTSSPSAKLDVNGNTNITGTVVMSSSFLRNRIINGDMRIDQRNAGASVTPAAGATYLVDRFALIAAQSSKLSAQQNAGAITPPTGFTNYLGFTSLSAYSTLSADYFTAQHTVEGFNISDFAWGTAAATSVTLSFFVRSSLTGTFGGSVYNSAANRSYPFTYAISASNTWEYKQIAIPGDTAGTWLTNSGAGIRINWGLGVGTTDSGPAGSWAGALYRSATGATSVVGTNGATFYITGVQLEVGTAATPFERRQYGQELALCQRYYQKGSSTLPGFSFCTHWLKVTMRTAPTMTGTAGATLSTITVDKFRSDNGATIADFDFTASAEL
jgi:hypothetical protein